MAFYLLLQGVHVDGLKTYKADGRKTVIESDTDLVKRFPNKFAKIDSEGDSVEELETETEKSTNEKDVTEDFSGAVEEELVVIRRGNKFYVYENDDLEKPIEGGKAVSKKSAAKAIVKYSDQ